MSKGLEALHHPRIKSAKVDISSEGKHDIAYMLFDYTKQYATIEKELKDVDEIMSNHNCSNLSELNERLCDYNELKFDDDIKQKKLRVLEIIKKRKCNVADFILDNPTWGEIQEFDYWFKETPTKEEFDLLKEVLL